MDNNEEFFYSEDPQEIEKETQCHTLTVSQFDGRQNRQNKICALKQQTQRGRQKHSKNANNKHKEFYFLGKRSRRV